MHEARQQKLDRDGDQFVADVTSLVQPRRPQDGPPMSDATRALHSAVLRHAKGILKAYEEWLAQQ
jgi:hypothetical protein